MKLEIKEIGAAEAFGGYRGDWDGFEPSAGNPANTVCHAELYRDYLSAPIFLEAYADGRKAAQWLWCKRRWPWNCFRLTLESRCGPQLASEFTARYDEVFQAFIGYLRQRYWPANISVLCYALARGITQSALQACAFARMEQYYSYVNTLPEDDEALIAQFHPSRRNRVRRARKDGCVYQAEVDPDEYYALSRETYRRSDIPGPRRRTVRRLHRFLAARHKALFSGVYVDGALKAASIIPYHGGHAFYLYGASSSDRSDKSGNATSYLHYENMRTLHGQGVRDYDFGGATLTTEKGKSLAEFKRSFGGAEIQCYGGILR